MTAAEKALRDRLCLLADEQAAGDDEELGVQYDALVAVEEALDEAEILLQARLTSEPSVETIVRTAGLLLAERERVRRRTEPRPAGKEVNAVVDCHDAAGPR